MSVPSLHTDEDVGEALTLIENANLPHPSGPLLSSFVLEALNPRLGAQYILKTCRSSHDQQTCLLQLVSDWTHVIESISKYGSPAPLPDAETQAAITKRDGGKCCITGKPGRFWDPLIVIPILPIPTRWLDDEARISAILGAFFTPSYRDWWLAYARNPENVSPLHSHWLVRRSAAEAFARGCVKLDRLQPSMVEYEVKNVDVGMPHSLKLDGSYLLLGDHSRKAIEKLDPRFPGTQARLSYSLRWLEIAKQLASDKEAQSSASSYQVLKSTRSSTPKRSVSSAFTYMISTTFLAVWLLAPNRMRIAAYEILRKIGSRMYGKVHGYESVQRLPFGLYLKYGGDPDGFRNEFNALKMVRQYTSVPVPRPLDLIVVPADFNDPASSQNAYLLTSRIPGLPLSRCQNMFSEKDGADFVAQMQDYLTQIRAIPKPSTTEYTIHNTLGKSIRDPRISWGDPVGPFLDEHAFNQLLRNSDDPARKGHKAFFTHADLNPRNILADRIIRPDGTRGWVLTGIVDWENSGYYPEYWEYTKAFYEGFRSKRRWIDALHEIFSPFGNLSKEFEVEKRSWEEGDYI